MKNKNLEENPFFERILELYEQLVLSNGDKSYQPFEYKLLSPKDKYVSDIFDVISNIIFTIDSLEYASVFIKKFPVKGYYERNNINRFQFTRYHLEIFYIKINSILDQLLLLVNEVYRLGLSSKSCTLNQIISNKHIKEKEVVKEIKNFNEAIAKVKELRNLSVHRGIFEDSAFKLISPLELLMKRTYNRAKRKKYKDLLTSEYEKIILQKLVFINLINKTISEFLLRFCNLLLKEFERIYPSLENYS